jgi:2-polyprenyl-3-methyl-5-hydroxy-6-metoxy-1,4-benzoquinol methylase
VEHTLETLNACPSCGNDTFVNDISCIDYTYSKNVFSIVECSTCKLHFTNPRPTEKTIGQYYDSPEYISHTDTSSGLLFTIYRLVKSYTLKQKRKLLDGFSENKTVLDYGAGSGDFSAELANHGWSVTSYEPNTKATGRIIKKHSKIVLADSLKSIDTDSKSVITLWHVLEHVHQLTETINQFNRILQKHGTLIIAVPNHTSYDATFYNSEWAAYDVPRHLYHFNPSTLETLISANGFRLEEIKPMWFDSFYVSLLSEKNACGSGFFRKIIAWPRALVIGLISNLTAVYKTRRCSSVIYILRKAI